MIFRGPFQKENQGGVQIEELSSRKIERYNGSLLLKNIFQRGQARKQGSNNVKGRIIIRRDSSR